MLASAALDPCLRARRPHMDRISARVAEEGGRGVKGLAVGSPKSGRDSLKTDCRALLTRLELSLMGHS